jgi:hypothetical protein
MATTSQRPRYPDDVNSMSDMALLEVLPFAAFADETFTVDELIG